MFRLFLFTLACASVFIAFTKADKIDRRALVTRHNVHLKAIDPFGALSVGNGKFAFTVDPTGLQSFPEYYEKGINLGTQSEWGWHSSPNEDLFMHEDVLENYETCNDRILPIATQHQEGRKAAATHWLRSNPHRLHLGLIGLELFHEDGSKATINSLSNIDQNLNLWTGGISSYFEIDNIPVQVELYAHQEKDLISFRIQSELIEKGRLKITFRFPYGKECHVCPGYDWTMPDKHQSRLKHTQTDQAWIERKLDSTLYSLGLQWESKAILKENKAHHFELTPDPGKSSFDCSALFTETGHLQEIPSFKASKNNSINNWKEFWQSGAAIDFSQCTDPRASELERRVILSQYLTKIQCSGNYPPQETGLTSNSWYGKFHLEMHWWHGVHFALWNRLEYLEKTMGWYQSIMAVARNAASRQGFEGLRWPKMTSLRGYSSPSSVGEFLIWQQPHPIYFAELIYRERPSKETLVKFQDIVFETADFMADFPGFDSLDGQYHLCSPLIPAQEIFPATETEDPPFELAYWHYGLHLAQQWRQRLGLPANEKWQHVLDHLSPLPQHEGFYLPAAGALKAYKDSAFREDHPIVTGALGILPHTTKIDATVMRQTFLNILNDWNWEETWGWDYPMLAMCAARLGLKEEAVAILLKETQKNTYLINGHNYQNDRLKLYLPGNGGLLTAVAMMTAGWDGQTNGPLPGFPDDGTWKVKWEGLKLMP